MLPAQRVPPERTLSNNPMSSLRTPVLRALLAAALIAPMSALASAPADLDLEEFATGLSRPLAIRHAGDGSGRLYVVERGDSSLGLAGRIRVLDANGALLGTVLDFGTHPPPQGFSVGSGGDERGLLGLAFHPEYPADTRLFVYYTDGNSDTVVASYTTTGSPPVATPASATVVLRVDQDFTNHNGGDIHFGLDGYLYIALGDGGNGNDPCIRAQTLDPGQLEFANSCAADGSFAGNNPESLALLGKMLRIDVDASTSAGASGTCGGNADGSANYAIPPTNPFAGGGTANGCDEVWHFGLRNPYRFSVDRATGDLFIGDVGQQDWEEVDYAAATVGGLNFGWRPCEGRFVTGSTVQSCNLAGSTLPILDYGRSGGACAVTGGYRYRGPIIPLQGDYVYADYCNGRVYIAEDTGTGWTSALWQDTPYNVSSFGEDEVGNLYLTNFFGGQVYRFTSAEVSSDLIFADGFED